MKEARRLRALELKIKGLGYDAIAEIMGVCLQTVMTAVRPPDEVRQAVIRRAGGKCEICRESTETGQLHHIRFSAAATSQFNSKRNLAFLCRSCHASVDHAERRGVRWPRSKRVVAESVNRYPRVEIGLCTYPGCKFRAKYIVGGKFLCGNHQRFGTGEVITVANPTYRKVRR